jgi:hypothetical protein
MDATSQQQRKKTKCQVAPRCHWFLALILWIVHDFPHWRHAGRAAVLVKMMLQAAH